MRVQKSMPNITDWKMARKARIQQEESILKLQNRIHQLKREEDQVLKKMDDTRRKAEDMIRFKTEKEEYVKRKAIAERIKLTRAKDLIMQTNETRI